MATPKYTPVANDFNSLLNCLNDINSHPGSKDKESLLKFYLSYTSFKDLVVAILDPYKMYGIKDFMKKLDEENWTKTEFLLPALMELLDDLKSRKLTGSAARLAAGVAVNNGVPGDLMTRILNKDPKAGFGITMVNKVMPGLLPEFPYMRCSLPEKSNMSKWNWSKGIYSQLKADGMFMNVNHLEGGDVVLMSRQGQVFPTEGFERFHHEVRTILKPGTQTHGEMVVYIEGKLQSRQEGNGFINSVAQGGLWPLGTEIVFMAWDQIPLSAVKPKVKYAVKYEDRLTDLKDQIGVDQRMIHLIPTKIVYSKKEAYEHFAEIVRSGGEGTVDKDPEAFWKDGTSKDQVKLKLEFVVDVEITGFTPGNGKFAKTFGAVTYKSRCGLVKGKVSGMDDKTRQEVSDNREKYLGTIMAVEANAVFRPSASNPLHSLSHPRTVEFRDPADKSVADNLEEILAQEQAAIENAAAI